METYSLDDRPSTLFNLIVADKSGKALDLASVLVSFSWEASLQNAASRLEAKLIAYPGLNQLIELADTAVLLGTPTGGGDVEEILRAYVWDHSIEQGTSGSSFSAFTQLRYMLENHDDYSFYNVSASSIFTSVCSGINIPFDPPPDTGYIIPKLIMRNARPYDVIIKALVLTREANGRKFFIRDQGAKLRLAAPVRPKLIWAIQSASNLISASFKESLDGMVNKIKVMGHTTGKDGGEGTSYVMHEESDAESIRRYGMIQALRSRDETATDKPSAAEMARTALKKLNKIQRTASVTAIGITALWPGDLVYIREETTGIVGVYYVESINNDVKPGLHTMSVNLRFDDLLEDPQPEGE